MIFLVVLVIAVVVGLIRGGKLGTFAELNIRWKGFILVGFLIQVLIFSDFWQGQSETRALVQLGYLTSLVLLLVALLVNHRIPGMWLISLGFLLNFIAIALNGGYMPASPAALEMSGHRLLPPGQVSNNSIGMGADTRVPFLCDIFAIPKGFIFPNVFSVGDALIAVGAVYMIEKTMTGSQANPHTST